MARREEDVSRLIPMQVSSVNRPYPYGTPSETLRHALRRAEASGGDFSHDPHEFFFRLAGRIFRLRFAGSDLAPLITPAFAHLVCEPADEPELTISIWDDPSTDTSVCPPTAGLGHGLERPLVFLRSGQVEAAQDTTSGLLWAINHSRRLALFRIVTPEQLPVWERAAPLRRILHWWATGQGLQLVHGAAVGTIDGGVLLVGRGGSGKSTCALACLEAGLLHAGDDYCLIEGGDLPRLHSCYSTAKIDRQRAGWFPGFESAISDAPVEVDGKAVLFLNDEFPRRLTEGFRLNNVVVPRITGGGNHSLTPLSAVGALKALAPSTIFQFPGAGAHTLARLADFVSRVPCHSLELGPDVDRLPSVIHGLLGESSR